MSTNNESESMSDALLATVAKQQASLITHSDEMIRTARGLKESYRFSRQLKTIFVATAVAMVLLIGLAVGLIVLAEQNHQNGTRTAEAVAAIKDCTEATGRCYQKQQQQGVLFMAQIISRNVEGFIVVSECSRTTTTDAALEKCVRHRLPQ